MTSRDDKLAEPTQLSGEMLNAHLLAMMKGWSAYGYELAQRLNEAGLGDYNRGSIYRALRQMEQTGLISSMWDTTEAGPARRRYSLTTAGSLFLKNWLALIDIHRSMVAQFITANRGPASDPERPAEEDV